MDKYFEQMTSYKGLFMRSFFMCRECNFVWTTLGQASHEIEGGCPSCGEYDFDYAPKIARDKFIKGVKEELEVFERELEIE
ncbi:hypothetical protein JCM9140_3121 [Halalkalibacter wakoensis JCM 9140]|uniref:Uncharacterized protein n=1 Tax=Halalkalibacter wakoensis JCM 9140 TaxID=1236970 RepID=W4Q4K8_9BACI|nr:hypothetical protein [Halalkalibacter wakoensis]GAE27011.1 hypothetical protein JCM9140_3121 [Halalkalibacter wakoensis JCM 9140]